MWETETRKLFGQEVLDFLENNRDYKIEVNDRYILIFKDQRILTVQEIDDLINFGESILKMFSKNLNGNESN